MRNISVSNCKNMEGVAIISLSFVIELTNWLRSAASLTESKTKYQGAGLYQMTEARTGRSQGGLTPHQTEKPQSKRRRKLFD